MSSIMTPSITSPIISPIISPITSSMILTIADCISSFTFEMNPLPHDSSVLHVNIDIHDIWTLKVFFETKYSVENNPYEVQIFRNYTNVNDTPFAHRTFLKTISETEQFINIFWDWSHNFAHLSFDDLDFDNNVAFIMRPNPISREFTAIFQITHGSHPGYYDISFADGIYNKNPRLKLVCLEKDDVTHYMRWFLQWAENFNVVNNYGVNTTNQQLTCDYVWNQYLSWIASWDKSF
jgi:hypothetical protein